MVRKTPIASHLQNSHIDLKDATAKADVQFKISTAKTIELEALQKELAASKEKLLKSTKYSSFQTKRTIGQLNLIYRPPIKPTCYTVTDIRWLAKIRQQSGFNV